MHRKIGILGGLSPESTVAYYEYITRAYTERFGDYGYPEIIVYSVSFQSYVDWPGRERWDLVTAGLVRAARSLEKAGADFIVIATNTMHLVFDQVQAKVGVPLLNLLDVVGDAVAERGLKTVGLLGTRFTMEKGFYQRALAGRGIEVLVPDSRDRQAVHDIIYRELVAGRIREASRRRYLAVIGRLERRGAQGCILGCTEIPLLIDQRRAGLPLFDTTVLHAEAALLRAVSGTSSPMPDRRRTGRRTQPACKR